MHGQMKEKIVNNPSGFTLIEILCVIIIIGSLGATALSQFLDFRREAYTAVLLRNLATMRSGLKNQTMQARLRCGVSNTDTWQSVGGVAGVFPFFRALGANFFHNDITHWENEGAFRICTKNQVTDVASRRFIDISDSERALGFSAGVAYGPLSFVPKNPFIDKSWPDSDGLSNVLGSDIAPFSSNCDFLTSYYSIRNTRYHWIYNYGTGEIFAGTNTPGIEECNL